MFIDQSKLTRILAYAASTLMMIVACMPIAFAAGELMVTPTRVVFEPRTRTAQVTLVNQGTETSNFRISFIRQNMTENGEFITVAESEAGLYSDPMIRYSPRQVSLPPGQSQVIRLLLRRPADLPDGEYRSHLLFQALPPPLSTSIDSAANNNAEGISIELIPIVGVSIPVIVRHGNLQSTVSLSNPEIIRSDENDVNTRISVDINREGNRSAYGDFRVSFTPDGGQPIIVGQANSVAIYANMSKRRFQMPINLPAGFELENGLVDIVFIKSGTNAEPDNLARTSLVIN